MPSSNGRGPASRLGSGAARSVPLAIITDNLLAIRMKSIQRHLIILLALTLALPAALEAQENAAQETSEPSEAARTPHFSIGVLGGMDRNYHIVDMSYMTDYSYSPYAPGRTLGLQLGYSPWKWLTLRLDGVMLDKNYYREHMMTGSGGSYPDTTTNRYVNVPLVVMLNVGNRVRLHAFGGVYGGYWLSSHRKGRTMAVFGSPEYDEEVDLGSEESREKFNRKDVGLAYGAGLSGVIAKRLEIGVEARWYYGIYDIQKEYMTNLNPRYNTTFVLQAGLSVWL